MCGRAVLMAHYFYNTHRRAELNLNIFFNDLKVIEQRLFE